MTSVVVRVEAAEHWRRVRKKHWPCCSSLAWVPFSAGAVRSDYPGDAAERATIHCGARRWISVSQASIRHTRACPPGSRRAPLQRVWTLISKAVLHGRRRRVHAAVLRQAVTSSWRPTVCRVDERSGRVACDDVPIYVSQESGSTRAPFCVVDRATGRG